MRFATLTPSTLDQQGFVTAFGAIFENADWVAKQAWQRGIDTSHDDIGALHTLLADVIHAAPAALVHALIDGHPRLAAKVPDGAGHASSRGEQARAGLAALDASERARFAQLNDAYYAKFGFPFILAVEGLASDVILADFERRLASDDASAERAQALEQVLRIGMLRLSRL